MLFRAVCAKGREARLQAIRLAQGAGTMPELVDWGHARASSSEEVSI